jgi:hypothetical protein
MVFKRRMNAAEPLFRNALPKDRFPAEIPDRVYDDAAQGRSSRRHQDVENKV